MNENEPKLLGVCLWLSDRFGVDLPNLRLLFIVTAILGIGTPILIYVILAAIKPKNPY